MMVKKDFLGKLRRINADAFLFSFALKSGDKAYLEDVSNDVIKVVGFWFLGEEYSIVVDKRNVKEILGFSFVPIILYYLWSGQEDKLRGLISVYRREVFGDLVLATAFSGSPKLFSLFLEKYNFLARTSTISYLLALDELLLRFSIDETLPFVVDAYNSLEIDHEEFQLRQAASSSLALAIKILHGDSRPCSLLLERLSINSRTHRYFRLYPMLAKNIYGCGDVRRALGLFSSLVNLVRLSVETTGEFRFIVPPSPKALAYVLRENAKMLAEFFIKIEDLARSKRFANHSDLAEVVMKLYNNNKDPRALLLAGKLNFLGKKNFEELLDSIRSALEQTPADGLGALFFDIGKILALSEIDEDMFNEILNILLDKSNSASLEGVAKGFFIETLKTYKLKVSNF